MIQYESADSPFFKANKSYCETIESKLKSMSLDYSGFCNSFGYEIESIVKKSALTYKLIFYKYQTTQNGVIIPVNARDSVGTEITVTGLNKKLSLVIGNSAKRRFFESKKFKDKVPAPYFLKTNYTPDDKFIDNVVKKILENNISKFNLSNGTLICVMHTTTKEPADLMADIETIAKDCI